MTATVYHAGMTRGCGKRQSGGVYIEVGTSGDGEGYPVEHFLTDPPVEVPQTLDIGARGVQLIERGGVWHVLDWVGEDSYPNVADLIEEVRRFGLSRRAQKTLEFGKLTKDSRILLIHRKAVVENVAEWGSQLSKLPCPKAACGCAVCATAANRDHGCAKVWWLDIEDGVAVDQIGEEVSAVRRSCGDTEYRGWACPSASPPRYRAGFFLSLPVGRIAVISGEESSEDTARKIANELAGKLEVVQLEE